MFCIFHFAKVVLHLRRSFPLTNSCHSAGWSSMAKWSPCLKKELIPGRRVGGYPLLVMIHVQGCLSAPGKEQVGLPVGQGDRMPLEADVEPSRREWLWMNQSQTHQAVLSHLSDISHAQSMSTYVLHSRKHITVMTKGSRRSVHACIHYKNHHCLKSSWGKRTNK